MRTICGFSECGPGWKSMFSNPLWPCPVSERSGNRNILVLDVNNLDSLWLASATSSMTSPGYAKVTRDKSNAKPEWG